MIGKFDTFEQVKEKRQSKNPFKNKKVTSQDIQALIGDYTFDNWGVCCLDLSEYDMSSLTLEDMTHISFNSSTIWPSEDKLPQGFNPDYILRDSIRIDASIDQLHKEGINGDGVTIAVIDSGFQAHNHLEFIDANLVKATIVEEKNIEYHFHMENVLSKLCGQKLGSAPKAKVLYYETSQGDEEDYTKELIITFKDILNRIKNGEQIRAVSCSFSIEDSSFNDEYKMILESLVKELKDLYCEVIDSDLFGYNFFCCGTSFMSYDINDYKVASFMKQKSDIVKGKCNTLCSGLALPEYCTDTGYKYEVIDCFSWTIPKVAGMYALALQVNPNLTFEEFSNIVKNNCDINDDGMSIINMRKSIDYIKSLTLYKK